MSELSHISFDVWNTLLIPNPTFANERAHIIKNAFELRHSVDQIKKDYTKLKSIIDKEALGLERAPSAIENWIRFMNTYPSPLYKSYNEVYDKVYNPIQKSFNQNPPSMLPETIKVIKELKQRGYSLSIGSNTNFISGTTLYRILQERTDTAFNFTVFSDLIGVSKPNPKFFQHILQYAQVQKHEIQKSHVLHVGDDYTCDFTGAVTFGFNALLCSKPEHVATDVTEFIDKLRTF